MSTVAVIAALAPLDRFATEGQVIEVRVPWWPATLFFVPSVRDLEALQREGIARERCWLPRDLEGLVRFPATPQELRAHMLVTGVVRAFDGEVTDILTPPTRPIR